MSTLQNNINTDAAGSYDFGTFNENDTELKRLMFQAEILNEYEMNMLKKVGVKKGMSVLDLACGPGIVSNILAGIVEDGKVTGVDISPDLLDVARAYTLKKGHTNITFEQGDVYNLDLSSQRYDFIYARFLFQHLSDPIKALESIKPLLKEGGTLCIIDIDDSWLSIYPEIQAFDSFTQKAALGQQGYGGDREVGKKLGAYLQQANFNDVNVQVETFSSKQMGMKNFLDITTGFKKEQVPEELKEESVEELETIYSLVKDDKAWGFVACFIGIAKV